MNNQAFGTVSLLFIDANIESPQLLADVQPGVQVYFLEKNQDGIQEITRIVRRSQQLIEKSKLSINIVAHAVPGSVRLGNSHLSLDTLDHYREQLQSWSSCSLHFYACNLAAGDAGEEFLTKLHRITGSTLHASTTKIGSVTLGGTGR